MANIPFVQCAGCLVILPVISNSFTYDKCLLASWQRKELHIQTLERTSESKSSVVSEVKGLDSLGRVSNSPTPALEPSKWGKWATSQRHSRKAKADAKAKPWEQHSAVLHLVFSPHSKPKWVLVIGDVKKLSRPLGSPAALVRCILSLRKFRFLKLVFFLCS